MCNLYRMTKATGEIARLFRVEDRMAGSNFGEEVYPGYPGAVIADGALRQMTWGFPLTMTGAKGQKLKPRPVNNARTDKLDSFMWRYSFEERRCLIPLTAWAEAEGPKGAMTRTWLTLPDADAFAAAGIWRASDEWGDVYSMVMTDSCGPVADCHDRMPVILHAEDHGLWTDGSPSEAKALCRPYDGPVVLDRTTQLWVARSG
jgi:putative SOS response-associated peptidase YedK